jgi:hypothetical protein
MIALLMLFLNWVNTTGEYIMTSIVSINSSDRSGPASLAL